MAQHEVLIQLALDSGTKYYSFRDVQMPTQFYDGRILGMGQISSEIGVIPSELRVQSFSLELNNADGAISELKASESFINREVKIFLGDVADSTSFTQQASFQSTAWSLSGDSFFIQFSDRTLLIFDQVLSPKLSTTLFPDLPDSTPRNLIPQVIGEVSQSGGAIPAYRVDPATSQSKYRYVACLDTAKSIDQVYIYGVVQGSGFTTSQVTYGGQVVTVIDFTSDPLDADRNNELEITWNGKGLTSDGSTSGDLLTNPSDIIKQVLLTNGMASGDIDSAGTFADVKNAFLERGIVGCFCAIDQEETLRELSEKFADSFNCTIIITADGKLGLTAPLPLRGPAVLEGLASLKEHQIIQNSFELEGVDTLATSLQFRYDLNFHKDSFGTTEQIDSSTELSNLGEEIIESVDLPYIQHTSSGNAIAADKHWFMQESRVLVDLHADPSFFKSLEIGEEIKLTHFRGLGSAGFKDTIFRVIRKSLSVDNSAMICALGLVDLSSSLGFANQFRKIGTETVLFGEYGIFNAAIQSDIGEVSESAYPMIKGTPVMI